MDDDFLTALRNSFTTSIFNPKKFELDALKKYFKHFPDKTQLSIVRVADDKVTFGGIKNEKDFLVIVQNQDSMFDIGSVTKIFTSTLLSKFIHDGLLKQDDPIKNHFDFTLRQSNLGKKEITFKNLANHTSGLPRVDMNILYWMTHFNNPYQNYDEVKLINYLKNKLKLMSVPGTKYNYSNLGAGLLGFIMCKMTLKSYEQLLQENIFIPWGMTNSTSDDSKIKTEAINGLNIFGRLAKNWTFSDAAAGAGAIKSTCKDLSRFIQANFDPNPILDLPSQKTFTIKNNLGIGLGWHIASKENKTIHWHNGGTGGYRSCLAIDKTNKQGVAVLSNLSPLHGKKDIIDKICFHLLE